VRNHLQPLEHSLRGADAALELEPNHSSKALERRLCLFVVGMGREAGIVHPGDGFLGLGPACNGETVGIVPLHPDPECPHPPVDQPHGMRIDGLSPEAHQPVDLLHQRSRSCDSAGDNVAVAVEILGGAGDHHIGPVLDRPEVEGTGEGGVDQQGQALFLRHVRDRTQVDHPHQRIGGGFHEDGPGCLAHSLAPVARLVGIDVGHLDPEAGQLFIEQVLGSAIDPAAGDQVVARAEHGKVGQRCGAHTTGQENRFFRSLQKRVLLGQRNLVGVVAVAAVKHLLFAADRIDEGAALVQ